MDEAQAYNAAHGIDFDLQALDGVVKYVYDSGALIAIDRSRDDSAQVTSHQERLAAGTTSSCRRPWPHRSSATRRARPG